MSFSGTCATHEPGCTRPPAGNLEVFVSATAFLNHPAGEAKELPAPPQWEILGRTTSADRDWQHVRLALSGDLEAQSRLFDKYFPRLFRAAYRMLRHKEDAEDVAQQSCLKALRNLHQYQGRAAFSTWLTQIAHNETIHLLRRKSASRELPILEFSPGDEDCLVLEFQDEKTPGPEDCYLQHERLALLHDALGKLKPRLREAVLRQDLQEMPPKEIARSLGISVAAAKSRILQGRRRMRQMIGQSTKRRPRPRPLPST